MNPDLKQHRIDLACALRWAARLNLHEGVDNHFSLAVPDADGVMRGNRFLINPYGWHWSEVTASSLVLCNDKGEVLEGNNEVEDTAFFIHSRIHIGASHAICVLHTHMPYATSITLLENGRLDMIEQNALLFDGRISYDDDYEGLALAEDEGNRLAQKIGNKSILFMASHGIVIAGPTVADAFNDLYYLERAAMFQVLAKSQGGKLRTISDQVRDEIKKQYTTEAPKLADRHFTALRRVLDKVEPSYRH
jgi:ribulose-5-phosphate 4-epimerase/fuculose-1-phosphate aldolase